MNRARYAHDAAYSRIATSLLYLVIVHVNQGKLERTVSDGSEKFGNEASYLWA